MATIKVKDKTLKVKLAITPAQQRQGLMNIHGMSPTKLPENSGMLFVYQREEVLSFWMKNTTLPLSIAFIDKNGAITEIRDMTPMGLDSVRSAKPAQYALEVNKGWFDKNNIKVGDKVNFGFGRTIRISIQPKVYTEE
tara:strand:+ start:107 stop:520 length:414 start_codon:yes stop_codon:yes gene_type:complete